MAPRSKRRRKHHKHFHRRTQPGAPPGTLVSAPDARRPDIQVLAYGADEYLEQSVRSAAEARDFLDRWPVTWVNVDGVGDATVVTELGELFQLHRLALEDVVHVHQRAKVEAYGDRYFLVARMACQDSASKSEQISMFFSDRFVVTFQEQPGGDCFEPVRQRIRKNWTQIRTARPDHLVYALLDAIVDHYFPLAEECGERLDVLEADALAGTGNDVMPRIHGIKRDLLAIRRAVWPLRDAINALMRDDTPLVSAETRVYLRDVHDHTIQIIDLVESYRDITSGITDVFLSRVSLRANDIMRVLTIIATIFIPLTFIVGVYGMNFNTAASPWSMPELSWRWGYPAVWAAMLGIGAGMLVYFRRKGWMGNGNSGADRPEMRANDS